MQAARFCKTLLRLAILFIELHFFAGTVALCRLARQFRNYRGGQQIIISNRELFP